jgi:hypothetical protein
MLPTILPTILIKYRRKKPAQNHAQNGTSDDITGDTFHITCPPSPHLTSNFNQQQPPYNNGNEKAISGETATGTLH